jgi:hypothetical protein
VSPVTVVFRHDGKRHVGDAVVVYAVWTSAALVEVKVRGVSKLRRELLRG